MAGLVDLALTKTICSGSRVSFTLALVSARTLSKWVKPPLVVSRTCSLVVASHGRNPAVAGVVVLEVFGQAPEQLREDHGVGFAKNALGSGLAFHLQRKSFPVVVSATPIRGGASGFREVHAMLILPGREMPYAVGRTQDLTPQLLERTWPAAYSTSNMPLSLRS